MRQLLTEVKYGQQQRKKPVPSPNNIHRRKCPNKKKGAVLNKIERIQKHDK